MRRVTILGATGSIGQNTLGLIRRGRASYEVVALTGGQNIARLAADAREFGARRAVTADPGKLDELRSALRGSGVETAAGPGAIIEAATMPADWTMSAIVGAAGIAPSVAAAGQGGTLALANKEALVAAGPLLIAEAGAARTRVLPVDSEHSGIFQALAGEDIAAVERVIITASGGPFRDWPVSRLARATLQEALNHPNWAMGQRITIDSASMFNKALELIETKEFFDIDPEKIEVLVHPESLVHALVGFCDGGLIAHLGPPDMRHAIGYALNWPGRGKVPVPRLNLASIGQLRFEPPDEERFPALRLARETIRMGGLAGAALNAAKEAALDAFIAAEIGFPHMADIVEEVLTGISSEGSHKTAAITLDSVAEMDDLARKRAREAIAKMKQRG